MTSNPDIIRKIWAVRSPYRRGPFYDAMKFDPDHDNLLSLRSESAHTALKAKMAPGYSGKDNDSLESDIDRNVEALVDLIGRKYVSKGTIFKNLDFARIAQYFTLDVISHVAFGKPFGFLENDEDVHEYIAMTEKSMPAMMAVSVMPWIAKIMQSKLCRGLLPNEKDKLGFGKFIAWVDRISDVLLR